VEWFARYGVRECWLVHQLYREIEVLEFAGGVIAKRSRYAAAAAIKSAVLPDFELSLDEILRDR
jgi:Uma2 family endonuclease